MHRQQRSNIFRLRWNSPAGPGRGGGGSFNFVNGKGRWIMSAAIMALALGKMFNPRHSRDQSLDQSQQESERSEIENVRYDDPDMNAAIDRARATLGEFIAAFQNPTESQRHFMIKARFVSNSRAEHMWLTELTFDGTRFTGKLGNRPISSANLKMGDSVTVSIARVTDWAYEDRGRLVGAFTIKAMDKLTDAEREKFKARIERLIQERDTKREIVDENSAN